ncbi:hypothetical protein F5Y10DRAFT_248949 [Nemania abortiva]|nr:hypothetical protein F5Y10DRAFT_248949 [Nemania abortiva]
MAPVTEVVLLTLAPGADYGAIIESAKTIARQRGCLAVRTSRLHDEPDKVHYFIDWDAVESHLAFMRDAPVYGAFLERLGAVMTGYAPPYHVELTPFPPVVFDGGRLNARNEAGGVMVGKAWFPGAGKGEGEEEEVSTAFAAFVGVLKDRALRGFTGDVAKGWSVESDILFKGEPSRVFLFAVGWDSVEACVRFRDSADFGEAMSAISGLQGLRELEVCIVSVKDSNDA